MSPPRRLVLPLRIGFGASAVAQVEVVGAQVAVPWETSRFEVVLHHVYPPVYPPLARQARIMGNVKYSFGVRQNGNVASAEVVSGHPMLQQAALESAQKSTFLCRECTGAVTLFTVTYTFGTRVDLERLDCGSATRLRAAKCLGLWRGGGWRSPPPQQAAVASR
jgi:TonB family protein